MISASSSSIAFQEHWSLHPQIYVAPYITGPLRIDGNLEKKEWSSIPWSSYFDDIRGESDAPAKDRPTSMDCRTRMKMLWDNDYLYVAAMMESGGGKEVIATYETRNSPIYQKDSDIEVFVDPAGCNHSYKELEMNAINTVWNLMLDRPYWDGGSEHSGRVAQPGDDHYYDVRYQKTAVKLLQGSLNNHNDNDQKVVWTVEIALFHGDTLVSQPTRSPRQGDKWRINLSRVEDQGKINWTWQSQTIWNPESRKHAGIVDVHQPNAWGYVEFGPDLNSFDDGHPSKRPDEVPRDLILNGMAGDPLCICRNCLTSID